MNTNEIIPFEIGDIVFCPYYRVLGRIVEFKPHEGFNYIIIKELDKDNKVSTYIKHQDGETIYYLQMICQRDNVDYVLKNHFKHKFLLNTK